MKLKPAFTAVRTRRLIGSGRTFFASRAVVSLSFEFEQSAFTFVFVVIVLFSPYFFSDSGFRFQEPSTTKARYSRKIGKFFETEAAPATVRLSGRLEAIQPQNVVCNQGVQDARELGHAIFTRQLSTGSHLVQ